MNSTQTASSQLLYTRNSKQSHQLEDSHPAGWTSFFFEDGESALVKLLAEQYKDIPEKDLALRACITPGVEASQTRLQAQARPRPVRVSKSGHAVEKSIQSDDPEECVVAVKDGGEPAQETADFEGYTLRDLRRLVAQMLPRYGRLLTCGELAALRRFESLPLRAQQLFARLLCRKWPQWVALEGLGSRYRELSSEDVAIAVADLSEAKASSLPECGLSETGSGGWATLLSQLPDTKAEPEESSMPWLLDTSAETAASLLSRQIPEAMASEDNYGKLLLGALPAAELRRMGKGLGISDLHGLGRRSSKSKLVSRLCEAAKQQRLLQTTRPAEATTEAQLVARSLEMGRWVCLAPSLGRRALVVLGEVFRLETCGAADSPYVAFSSRWPDFSFQPDHACPPLFADRASLDAFVEARRLVCGMEKFQEMRPSLDHADSNAKMAEEGLERALQAVHSNEFEAAKFRDPFRRRFTAAWCYAEALHHAVLHSPAVGHDKELQASKVRRLRLLLTCTLCSSQRGRWYAELAKEAARCEGLLAAIEVAAAGLAEGEDKPLSVRVAVDLTLDMPSPQEAGSSDLAQLPRDARWDLARRCRVLARRLAKAKGSGARQCDWQKLLQNTQVAQRKA
ncbi:fan1, partial [Symbiodinium necroappetens]